MLYGVGEFAVVSFFAAREGGGVSSDVYKIAVARFLSLGCCDTSLDHLERMHGEGSDDDAFDG